MTSLVRLVARLRRDCPWDRDQTFETTRPYLLEEAHEVVEALDVCARAERAGTPRALSHLREELGDLLFEIALLAQIATEQPGGFTLDDVVEGVMQKMIERHPHVFAAGTTPQDVARTELVDAVPPDPAEAAGSIEAWEVRKAASRPERSRVDGVPTSLPALLRAHRVGEKLAHIGFDWPDLMGVFAKVDEERAELDEALKSGSRSAIVHEYGDLLLATASLGRFLNVPAEDALREANTRFEGRFRVVERLAAKRGIVLDNAGSEVLDGLWEAAKRSG
jgi:ATP diphosphatase